MSPAALTSLLQERVPKDSTGVSASLEAADSLAGSLELEGGVWGTTVGGVGYEGVGVDGLREAWQVSLHGAHEQWSLLLSPVLVQVKIGGHLAV